MRRARLSDSRAAAGRVSPGAGAARRGLDRRPHRDADAVRPRARADRERRRLAPRPRAHLVGHRAQGHPQERRVAGDELRGGVDLHRDVRRVQLREEVLDVDRLLADLAAAECEERPAVLERRGQRGREPEVLLEEPGRRVVAAAHPAEPLAELLERAHDALEAAQRRRAGERQLERTLGGARRLQGGRELEGDRERARDLAEVLERADARPSGVGAVVEDGNALDAARRAERRREHGGEGPLGRDERLLQRGVVARVGERGDRSARRHLEHVAQRGGPAEERVLGEAEERRRARRTAGFGHPEGGALRAGDPRHRVEHRLDGGVEGHAGEDVLRGLHRLPEVDEALAGGVALLAQLVEG